jgi:hypothetical protein
MPGDNLTIDVSFVNQLHECWFTFAIREGGRTVGAGQVTENCIIYNNYKTSNSDVVTGFNKRA